MDKTILSIIADFSSWKGDTYRLASLIIEAQKELDRQAVSVISPEAAEAI